MMKHAGGEYVDAALDDTEATGDGEDQEGEAADMLGAEEKRSISSCFLLYFFCPSGFLSILFTPLENWWCVRHGCS